MAEDSLSQRRKTLSPNVRTCMMYCARINRPSFREKLKTLVFNDWKRENKHKTGYINSGTVFIKEDKQVVLFSFIGKFQWLESASLFNQKAK